MHQVDPHKAIIVRIKFKFKFLFLFCVLKHLLTSVREAFHVPVQVALKSQRSERSMLPLSQKFEFRDVMRDLKVCDDDDVMR